VIAASRSVLSAAEGELVAGCRGRTRLVARRSSGASKILSLDWGYIRMMRNSGSSMMSRSLILRFLLPDPPQRRLL
jgi:hypothetical protein